MKLRNSKIMGLLLAVVFSVGITAPAKIVKADETINRGQAVEVTTSGEVSNLLNYAQRFLGCPYEWGATGPNSFDCSGFTQYVFRNAAGLSIGRSTYDQINAGTEVSYNELQPGDLVFPHSGHVGIYMGNGQMIHAPQTGEVVKITPVYKFWRARRVLGYSPEHPEVDVPDVEVPDTETPGVDMPEVNVPDINISDIVGHDVAISRPSNEFAALVCNADYYRRKYADLNNAFGTNYNALYNHFINCGIAEGRNASEVFDPVYYLNVNPDLQKAFGKKNYKAAFNHFITYGYKENRKLSPIFDMAYYKLCNPDVANAFGDNYYAIMNHFLVYGMKEGRSAASYFNVHNYKDRYEDLRNAYGNNIVNYYEHYLIYGFQECRIPV